MAHKLSDKHLAVKGFTKMSVKLAAQVLSHTVASTMCSLVQIKVLPEEALLTADFIARFDTLFNMFNSGTSKNATRQMGHAYSEKTDQKTKLEETSTWLYSVQRKSKYKIHCLYGWRVAISSLIGLFDDLKDNHSVKYLLTDRLNQDCLENFFSCVRGKGGHRTHPSATEFRLAYRQILVDYFNLKSSRSNCLEDGDSFLLRLTPQCCTGSQINQKGQSSTVDFEQEKSQEDGVLEKADEQRKIEEEDGEEENEEEEEDEEDEEGEEEEGEIRNNSLNLSLQWRRRKAETCPRQHHHSHIRVYD